MKIGVVGLGFVGLTTALGFAHKGFQVYAYDISDEKRTRIKQGEVPFFEPHLDEVLRSSLEKNLFLADSIETMMLNVDVIFICVGTPASPTGEADLSHLFGALESCGSVVRKLKTTNSWQFKTLVIKSTVPPTTGKKACELLTNMGLTVGDTIGFGSNPEFLREGYAWTDFVTPDRIVIGADDSNSQGKIAQVYKAFDAPIHLVSLNTAEFIKYLSNCLLSTLISFSNEMATVADLVGEIDIPQSFKILHQDKRWNGNPASMTSYVYPGCGFGGYCLPKDTEAFCSVAQKVKAPAEILKAVLRQNDARKLYIAEKVATLLKGSGTIAVLGLSFKPGSDDIRETPAKLIIESLLNHGYKDIIAYDPISNNAFAEAYNLPILYADSMSEALKRADVAVLLTSWPEFKDLQKVFFKAVVDGRYFL